MVKANALTKQEIVSNFRNGSFYTSNGATLSDYQVNYSAKTIFISVSNGNNITFIGENGATLRSVSGSQATYQYTGTAAEKYIRVKVTGSSGAAWTQPVYFSGGPGPTNTPGPTATPTTPGCINVADINCDGGVNFEDMKLVLAAWGNSGGSEDLDGDQKVNLLDASIVIANWL